MKHNLDDLRAEKYESSKETEPEDEAKCPVCDSKNLDYSGGKYFWNKCGETF